MMAQAKVADSYTGGSQRTLSSGVFPQLIDRRAFIDKIVLSIWGDKRTSPDNVRITRNRPIGGKNRNYARSERGVLLDSGNPYELRYGPMRRKGSLPPLILVLRSERSPATVASALAAIDSLCEDVSRTTVSQVELTFDLSGVSVEWLRKRVFTRARNFRRLVDASDRRTLYVGGRTSHWQLRIYDKAPEVVRLEFVLRRPFLLKIGINVTRDLELLRGVNLKSLIRIRRVNKYLLLGYVRRLEEIHRRLLRKWLRDLSFCEFSKRAKNCQWELPAGLFVPSRFDKELWRMQAQLVL